MPTGWLARPDGDEQEAMRKSLKGLIVTGSPQGHLLIKHFLACTGRVRLTMHSLRHSCGLKSVVAAQAVARVAARDGGPAGAVPALHDPIQPADPDFPLHHPRAGEGLPVQIPPVGLPDVPC